MRFSHEDYWVEMDMTSQIPRFDDYETSITIIGNTSSDQRFQKHEPREIRLLSLDGYIYSEFVLINYMLKQL